MGWRGTSTLLISVFSVLVVACTTASTTATPVPSPTASAAPTPTAKATPTPPSFSPTVTSPEGNTIDLDAVPALDMAKHSVPLEEVLFYSREVEGETLLFGNTSALYESDLVMYDHQTGS